MSGTVELEKMDRVGERFLGMLFTIALHLIDEGVLIVGDPDDVSTRLMEVYEEIGGFGTVLMVCGKDWGTWEQRQRSWRAIMKHVAPRFAGLNGAMPARAMAH